MTEAEEKLLDSALAGVEQQMLVDLPTKIQSLRPEMQADVNRVAQKTFQAMKGIGNLTPAEMQEKINEVTKMQANLTEKYGTDGNK